jgi:hypothetical protein
MSPAVANSSCSKSVLLIGAGVVRPQKPLVDMSAILQSAAPNGAAIGAGKRFDFG